MYYVYAESLHLLAVGLITSTPPARARTYVSDDRDLVGSANMDYRSLYRTLSCCAFYGGHMVRDVLKDVRDAGLKAMR